MTTSRKRQPAPSVVVPPAVFRATLSANRQRRFAEVTGRSMAEAKKIQALPPLFGEKPNSIFIV